MADWVLKRVLKSLLKRSLGRFLVNEVDLGQIDVQLGQGQIELRDVLLNVDNINQQLVSVAVCPGPSQRPLRGCICMRRRSPADMAACAPSTARERQPPLPTPTQQRTAGSNAGCVHGVPGHPRQQLGPSAGGGGGRWPRPHGARSGSTPVAGRRTCPDGR